ncbi:hypothetical protein AURDEDRAFT_162242 [Auricularia subglabra TFB-10046 SS5]|nr:hypothetical protein AURDEDRAFT_162242 [Auricularia subglabra TFB-10046 SS5]
MAHRRGASAAPKAGSTTTSKQPAASSNKEPTAAATGGISRPQRTTRSRAAALATAPTPALEQEPRKRRKAIANENAPIDRTDAPASAENDAPKPRHESRRRAQRPARSEATPDVEPSDQTNLQAAPTDTMVPAPCAPAGIVLDVKARDKAESQTALTDADGPTSSRRDSFGGEQLDVQASASAETPAPAGNDAPKPHQKRQRREPRSARSEATPDVERGDHTNLQGVPTDAVVPAPCAPDSIVLEVKAGENAGSQAGHTNADGPASSRRDSLVDELPDVQAGASADSQAAPTDAGNPARRLDNLAPELIDHIFKHIPSTRDLAALATVKREFHEISNAVLYRRIVGLFDLPTAQRLCVTMIKRPNFACHTRVFDGQRVAAQLPVHQLNLFAAALLNMPRLKALTLPPVSDAVLADCTYPDLRVLRVLGPSPPLDFIARHPELMALEFHPATITELDAPDRIGRGSPLAFVRCCMSVATQLLFVDPHALPDTEADVPRRTFARQSTLDICAATMCNNSAMRDATEFLAALAETKHAPRMLVLDRQVLEDLSKVIDDAKPPVHIFTVAHIRVFIDVSSPETRVKNMEYLKSILRCFRCVVTLEIRDDETPASKQEDEESWFNDSQFYSWKTMRPSLAYLISPQKRAYVYRRRYFSWERIQTPVYPPNPFRQRGFE